MKIILDDLKIKYEAPMGLACDNKFAISIVAKLKKTCGKAQEDS